MRKNGYSKKILMLLAGLNSICCCSAMEKNTEKPKSKTSADVRKRKALTPKKSKSEVSEDARTRSLTPKNSMTLDNILKKRRLGLFTPEQQMRFDKKFGLVDPRRYNGDIIPTIEQILEIFENKIKSLHDEAYRINKNKLNNVGLNLSPLQIINRMEERVTLLRLRNGSSCIEEHSPLSYYTMAKLGAWNCRSVACAMQEFLQELQIDSGKIYEPTHVSVVTLVDVSEDMKPLLGDGVRATVLECFEDENNPQDIQYGLYAAQYLKRFEYVDEPFFPDDSINLNYTIVDPSMERCSIPLFVLIEMLNPNFKMGEKETTVLRNKILDELRRLISSGTMLGMPFLINRNNGLEVWEIDTNGLSFLESKKMNKDIIIKKYLIENQNFEALKKILKMNSKWEDVKNYFTLFEEMTIPADLS